MGVKERRDAGGSATAAVAAPVAAQGSPPLVQGAAALRRCSTLQSYVLSGAADPPLVQQARAMQFQLLFAAVSAAKLAAHLSPPQLR